MHGIDSWDCMEPNRDKITILMADDDPDDRMLLEDAWGETDLQPELRFVGDGEELLDYLRRRGPFAGAAAAPEPALILLDLNMPKKDGREVLAELKADRQLRHIPVVVLSTSRADEDIARSYALGVSGFITKPSSFAELVRVVRALQAYWLDVVQLPRRPEAGPAAAQN